MKSKYQEFNHIDLSDYELYEIIGRGSFGMVRLVKNKLTSKYSALKMMVKTEMIKQKQVDHIFSEISIMNGVNHPFLVCMEGIAQDECYFYILMEFVGGGELFTYLRTMQSLTESEAKFFASQVVLMFEYLHSHDIVYRDLKPENLLISKDGYLKLIDFGFAKRIKGRSYTLCGTPEYLAPEILLRKGHGKAVDWWCLGILIYEMVVGMDPFSADNPIQIYKNILENRIFFPASMPKHVKRLIKNLLRSDLDKRFGNLRRGVEDIKKHRWFNEIDFNEIRKKKVKAVFKPEMVGEGDTNNFATEREEPGSVRAIEGEYDPFLNW